MQKEQLKDLVERAAWTFAQGFLAALLVGVTSVTDWQDVKVVTTSLVVGAVAGGISALKTFVKETL